MTRPNWHTKIVRAIREMHEIHRYKLLKPSVVFLRLPDGRVVRYHPDALLLRKTNGIHAVVIEAESGPPAKVIPGDVSLASFVEASFAEMYPKHQVGIGRSFRGERQAKDTYDVRSRTQSISGKKRLLLKGNEIGHCCV